VEFHSARRSSPSIRRWRRRADRRRAEASSRASDLAGEPILARLTTAPGNGAPIGGLKVVAEHGWFAARPSGTEHVYKLYAESFRGVEHLRQIQDEARDIISAAFLDAGGVNR